MTLRHTVLRAGHGPGNARALRVATAARSAGPDRLEGAVRGVAAARVPRFEKCRGLVGKDAELAAVGRWLEPF